MAYGAARVRVCGAKTKATYDAATAGTSVLMVGR